MRNEFPLFSVVVRKALLEMMVWRDPWKQFRSKNMMDDTYVVLLSCLLCRLFLLMNNEVENGYKFPYKMFLKVPSFPVSVMMLLKGNWTWICVNCLRSLTHGMRRHHLRRINGGGYPIGTWQLLFPRLETASLRMINDKVEGQEVKLAGYPGIW